jgi:hypothetical protein
MASILATAESVVTARVDPENRARLEAYRGRFDPPVSRSRAIANLIAEALAALEPVVELPARLPRPRKPLEEQIAKRDAKAARAAKAVIRAAQAGALKVGKRKKRPGISDDKPSQIMLPREVPQMRGRLTLRQWVERRFGPGPYPDELSAKLGAAHQEAIAHGLHQETSAYFAFMEFATNG